MPNVTIRSMPVAELITLVTPANGGTWDNLVASFMADPYESATVNQLRAEWRTNGRFDTPVVVKDGLANGQHRITAAIVEGISHLDVADGDVCDYDSHVEVEIILADLTNFDEDMFFDHICSTLRSFRLDADTWVECYGPGSTGQSGTVKLDAVYVCPPEKADALVAAVTERLAPFNLSIRSIVGRPYSFDDLD